MTVQSAGDSKAILRLSDPGVNEEKLVLWDKSQSAIYCPKEVDSKKAPGSRPGPEVIAVSKRKDRTTGNLASALTGNRAADQWANLGGRFRALSEEGKRKAFDLSWSGTMGRELRAGNQHNASSKPKIWEQGKIIDMAERPTDEFVARFEALVTRAAHDLEVPEGIVLLRFWLESVQRNTTDWFNDLCEASAAFCSHLERQALEKATERSSAVGRPRKDSERKKVREMKEAGQSWKDIAAKMNEETGQNKSPGAYRSLLSSLRTRKP